MYEENYHIYIIHRYYSITKNNEILPCIRTWMNLEDIVNEIILVDVHTIGSHVYLESETGSIQSKQ